MTGKSCRDKGHSFERMIAKMIRDETDLTSYMVHRGAQSRSGSDAPDVVVPGQMWIECKRGRRVNVKSAIEQAISACTDSRSPVVISKDDGGRILVTMLFEDWIKLARDELVAESDSAWF